MADNVQINAMAGGDTIAADDIAGIKYQRVKIGYGGAGAFTDVTTGAPLPAFVLSGVAIDSDRATVATAGTRVRLPGHPQTCGVTVRARVGNAGVVYIGGSTVSESNGFELLPGEAVSLDVADTAAIFIDADSDGDGVSMVWVSA